MKYARPPKGGEVMYKHFPPLSLILLQSNLIRVVLPDAVGPMKISM
jgi:hypothetical protein